MHSSLTDPVHDSHREYRTLTTQGSQSTGSVPYLVSGMQALLLKGEWTEKTLAGALETSAGKEPYLFLQMAF